jgi:hypothetical protein
MENSSSAHWSDKDDDEEDALRTLESGGYGFSFRKDGLGSDDVLGPILSVGGLQETERLLGGSSSMAGGSITCGMGFVPRFGLNRSFKFKLYFEAISFNLQSLNWMGMTQSLFAWMI